MSSFDLLLIMQYQIACRHYTFACLVFQIQPDRLRDLTADDFFAFKTAGLPSKINDPELFVRKCAELRSMWVCGMSRPSLATLSSSVAAKWTVFKNGIDGE